MANGLWQLDDVVLAGQSRPRLDGVTLTIRTGVTAIAGYSGAGKTSLLNLLVGFEQPDSGLAVSQLPKDGGRLPLFWVPQSFGLWPHMSAARHLEAVSPGDDPTNEVALLLERFELTGLADARPGRMSQGERSRLAVARAIASRAAVLVMDEPLAHVDPARIDRFWDVIRETCRERETSLVFSTHAPEVVLADAEQTVCLDSGRVVYSGEPAELYHRPPTAELSRFLGPSNWFTPDDASRWLNRSIKQDECIRPETLHVTADSAGRFVVAQSQFMGGVAMSTLRDEEAKVERRFYHSARSHELSAGDRVVLWHGARSEAG